MKMSATGMTKQQRIMLLSFRVFKKKRDENRLLKGHWSLAKTIRSLDRHTRHPVAMAKKNAILSGYWAAQTFDDETEVIKAVHPLCVASEAFLGVYFAGRWDGIDVAEGRR